jgi:hypothetical protein
MVANQLGHSSTRIAEEHYAYYSPSFIASTIRAKKPKLLGGTQWLTNSGSVKELFVEAWMVFGSLTEWKKAVCAMDCFTLVVSFHSSTTHQKTNSNPLRIHC